MSVSACEVSVGRGALRERSMDGAAHSCGAGRDSGRSPRGSGEMFLWRERQGYRECNCGHDSEAGTTCPHVTDHRTHEP